MKNIIGVRSIFDPSSLKQQAIMFDQIAISELDHFILDSIKGEQVFTELSHDKQFIAELEWLKEKKIIFSATVERNISEINSEIPGYFLKMYKIGALQFWLENSDFDKSQMRFMVYNVASMANLTKDEVNSIDLDEFDEIMKKTSSQDRKKLANELKHLAIGYDLRATGLFLEKKLKTRVIPIVPKTISEPFHSLKDDKCDVIQVIIKSLPEPDDSTPWEKIIDFKNDQDAIFKLKRLRQWINKIGNNEISSPLELEEELEFLLHEYEDHMRIHKMKINSGIFETTITTIAGLIENSIKLKLKDSVNSLFILRKRRISLLEAERKAPGREVAYISKAREFFH